MTRISIIADDLTGALDTASPFACRGLRVVVALSPEYVSKALDAAPDVIAVSTNSRGLAAAAAAAEAGRAARLLRDWRPALVLKKIDSRLKGNIASETAAVAEVFGMREILVVPALPEQGRSVRNGCVEGAGVAGKLAIADHLPGSPLAVSIPDAASDGALDEIAAALPSGGDRLAVCTRGFASALARRLPLSAAPPAFALRRPALLALGSRDPITLRQIEALRAAAPAAAYVEAPNGRLPPSPASGEPTIFACTAGATAPHAAVVAAFARAVAYEVRRRRPATMLLCGGDTAFAVLRALDVRVLTVLGEAAPGLPWFEIAVGSAAMVAVCKSGGFGGPQLLATLFGNGDSRG